MDAQSVVNEITRINAGDFEPSGDRGSGTGRRSADARTRAKKNTQNGTGRAQERRSASAPDRQKRRKAARRREVLIYTIEAIVLVGAMGALIGYLVWHNSFTDVKISDHVNLTLSGYDHYGTASISVDGDPQFSAFWSSVTASVNKDTDLSNGDELNITYTYDEEIAKLYKLKVDATEASLNVDGLMESTVVDSDFLFSGLDIEQTGISPKISIALENTSEDPFISQVTYYIDSEKSFFANGDTAVIKAEIPEELFESHAYVPGWTDEELTYEYEPASEEMYVMSAGMITDDVLSTLEQIGADLIYASDANEYGLRIFQQEAHIQPVFRGNKTTFRWANPYMISAYFHNVTEAGLDVVENHANDVQIVYGVTITQDDGKSCLAEVVVQFTNIVEHADHTLELSADTGRVVSATYRDKNIKKLVSVDSSEDYDTVKLTE